MQARILLKKLDSGEPASQVAQAATQWMKPHRDALLEVDSCLPLGPIGGLHVHLREGAHSGIACDSDYIVIA